MTDDGRKPSTGLDWTGLRPPPPPLASVPLEPHYGPLRYHMDFLSRVLNFFFFPFPPSPLAARQTQRAKYEVRPCVWRRHQRRGEGKL